MNVESERIKENENNEVREGKQKRERERERERERKKERREGHRVKKFFSEKEIKREGWEKKG